MREINYSILETKKETQLLQEDMSLKDDHTSGER